MSFVKEPVGHTCPIINNVLRDFTSINPASADGRNKVEQVTQLVDNFSDFLSEQLDLLVSEVDTDKVKKIIATLSERISEHREGVSCQQQKIDSILENIEDYSSANIGNPFVPLEEIRNANVTLRAWGTSANQELADAEKRLTQAENAIQDLESEVSELKSEIQKLENEHAMI